MPATSQPPTDGARPGRRTPALLGASEGPLARVRRIFVALALLACALAAVAIGGMPDRTAGLRMAGIVAVVALALVWLHAYRRGGLSAWDDPIELLALFIVGLAAGPDAALAVVYTGLWSRSLYGSRARAALGLAVYSSAHVAAVVVSGGGEVAPVVEQLAPLALGCAVMQAFAALLVRHERSLERERILREASAAFVAAPDRSAVHAAALTAAERLVGGQPAVLAATGEAGFFVRGASEAWLPDAEGAEIAPASLSREVATGLAAGRAVPIESPRLAGLELYAPPEVAALAGDCLPLSTRGELRGFLAVFGPVGLAADEVDALASVAGEAALALAALDAADAAADDRWIRRLGESVRE